MMLSQMSLEYCLNQFASQVLRMAYQFSRKGCFKCGNRASLLLLRLFSAKPFP
jgi:hypothetical protein